jgi:hypothetical protein
MLARSVPLIVDTRNAMKDVPEGLRSRVVKA